MPQNNRETSGPLVLALDGLSAEAPPDGHEIIRARPDIWLCITRDCPREGPRFRLDAAEPVLALRFGMPRPGGKEKGALPDGMFLVLPPGRHDFTAAPPRGIVVCITESRLRAVLADDARTLPEKILSALAARGYGVQTPEPVPLFPEEVLVASSLMYCPHQGAVKNMFVKSKALELIALFFLRLTGAGSGEGTLSPGDRAIVAAAKDYFLARMENAPTVRQLARHAGTSETRLQRLFRRAYGHSVGAHLRREKMAAARGMILFQGANVSEAAFAVGYDNVSHFIDAFTKQYGIRPGEMRLRRPELRPGPGGGNDFSCTSAY
jgi:AraC-like DNA-binding protein